MSIEIAKIVVGTFGSGGSTEVIDGLTSTSTTAALSANQGRVLKGFIDNIEQGGDAATLDGQEGVYYLSRANHSGTQGAGTITEDATHRFVTDAEKANWNAKQSSEPGKGLSTNDYTTAEKTKLAGLESSKFKGQYPSLAALIAANVGGVGNYAYVDEGVGQDVSVYAWDDTDSSWVLQKGETVAETPASIKSKYESNPDTNAFTDSEKTKLSGLQNYDDTALSQAVANLDVEKADINSPAFTGTPTAPTRTAGDNSPGIATTAFVMANSVRMEVVSTLPAEPNENTIYIID